MSGGKIDIEGNLREPTYVPENISVLRLLEIFRKTPMHIAFVVDEYGDFLGLVSLTDILGGGGRSNLRKSTIPASRT